LTPWAFGLRYNGTQGGQWIERSFDASVAYTVVGEIRDMRLEEEREEKGLLTTDEAQDLIALFAEKEQARRAEVERMASMPALSDLAGLIGVSVDALLPLLARIRGEALQGSGDTRITQQEADRLLELYGEAERESQAEQERRAQMTSLKDVAEGLHISVGEADSLLGEVRRRRNSPPRLSRDPGTGRLILIPSSPMAAERPETSQATFDDGLRRVRTAAGVVLGLVVFLALVFTVESHALSASPSGPGYYQGISPQPVFPTYGGPPTASPYVPSASTLRYRRAEQTLGARGEEVIYGNVPQPPPGWTVRVYDEDGRAELTGQTGAVLNSASEGVQLENSVQGMMNAVMARHTAGGATTPAFSADPWLPPVSATRSCDLAGKLIAEVEKVGVVKRVYVPERDLKDSDEATYDALIRPRLDYLAGFPDGSGAMQRAERIHSVTEANCIPPAGMSITLVAGGRVFQAVGPAAETGSFDQGRCQIALERALRALLQVAARRVDSAEALTTPSGRKVLLIRDASGASRLVDANCTVNVYNGYRAESAQVDDLQAAANAASLPSGVAAAAGRSANGLAHLSGAAWNRWSPRPPSP
jgi:hypothetical protein